MHDQVIAQTQRQRMNLHFFDDPIRESGETLDRLAQNF
jgi:hypothetical protein